MTNFTWPGIIVLSNQVLPENQLQGNLAEHVIDQQLFACLSSHIKKAPRSCK